MTPTLFARACYSNGDDSVPLKMCLTLFEGLLTRHEGHVRNGLDPFVGDEALVNEDGQKWRRNIKTNKQK